MRPRQVQLSLILQVGSIKLVPLNSIKKRKLSSVNGIQVSNEAMMSAQLAPILASSQVYIVIIHAVTIIALLPVVTLWYRAPEVLLGSTDYSWPIHQGNEEFTSRPNSIFK